MYRLFAISLFPILASQDLFQGEVPHNVSPLQPGKYAVGCEFIRQPSSKNTPLLFTIWYPATRTSNKMTLNDFVLATGLQNSQPDVSMIDRFLNITKRVYEHVTDENVREYLNYDTPMTLNAPHQKGKFPLVLMQSDPAIFYETASFLASNGFVVATANTQWQDTDVDSLLYKFQTDIIEELFIIMSNKSYVDEKQILAFGFGGGIQGAMYLSMRRPEIKKVVNVDGGFFDPRSRSTASVDYHPKRLKASMLNIETQSQRAADDKTQVKNLPSPVLMTTVRSEFIRHHDFTAWGRAAASSLKTEDANVVDKTYQAVHTLILQFLQSKSPNADEKYLTPVEKLN